MSKARTYQKTKLRHDKVRSLLAISIWAIIVLLFFTAAIQNLLMLKNWDTGAILDYSGQYTFQEKKHIRNTKYLFELSDDITLEIHPEYVTGNAHWEVGKTYDSELLHFRYAIYKEPFGTGYPIVSIYSEIDGTIYVSADVMKEHIQFGARIYLLLGIVSSLPLILLAVVRIRGS